jgi:hypothetical protein
MSKHNTPHHGRQTFFAAFMSLFTSFNSDIARWPLLSCRENGSA